jgi:glycogen phosphorylase
MTDGSIGPFDGRRDLRQAVADLAERLPPPLQPLARLAYNYRWTWLAGADDVFRDLDPALWEKSGGNPRWLIEALPPHRFRSLEDDARLVARVATLGTALDADLARAPAPLGVAPERPVAYLCSEFGLHRSLPLYGGGLGVLAGDVLKGASDLALPMVGVGLLYRQGYFHQRVDLSGWQQEYWTTTDVERLPMVRVTDGDDRPLSVEMPMRGRTVRAHIWRVDVGRVPLYLLDTDRPDNHPIDRWITARLYIGDRHTRLAQYGVLGVGGLRALHALGVTPGLVHLNEGHPGLSGLERMRELVGAGASVGEALARARASAVFTTHTPVAAGNEWYSPAEVEPVLGSWMDTLGFARDVVYGLGRMHPERGDEAISITPLALRTSRAAIGVSRRHGEVARGMWQPLWSDRRVEDVPIGHVTNGVHTTSAMAEAMQALLDRHLPRDWRARIADPTVWQAISAIPDAELWEVRRTLRQALVDYARERSVFVRLARGESPDYVEAAARVFDPNVLTIGFARRVATYKRLSLLVRQPERGLRLLADAVRPIQLLIAGKAHPQDSEAKETLRRVLAMRGAPNVGSRIVFLDDYDLHMAPRLTSGVDLWLNLPRPPLEASGTSGMKVAANGGLNLSVLDGWWIEGYEGETGWAIDTPAADPETQDDHDAGVVYDLLEREVIPLFYERDADGLPRGWLRRVKASMTRLVPAFSAERMLREYVARLYVP